MGTVIAVCTSPAKGTQKTNVNEAVFIEDHGIQGDAHAGKWHRQVSLLSYDKIEEFRARGADVENGAFGENLVVQGIDFRSLPVGTRLCCGGRSAGDNADWERVPSRLSDISENGRVYHAPGRCVCESDPRRVHKHRGRDASS